ncbi:MAG: 2-isopropylmalate synthase [bacterium]|nr:2-isopropylmalate synthase [bacterium]
MSDYVRIFDTTLRDGEQCPGATMNLEEKLRVARQLALLNVDVIEAGFPIASKDDFEAVKTIAGEIEGPEIAGLCRCLPKDIERGWQAVKGARKPRLHIFLATSKIHLQYKLRKAEDEILRQAVEMTKYAASLCANVEFSPEDASRTERSFLAEVVEAVIEAGATTVNIPDTVGYAVPWEYGETIKYLRTHVKNIDRAVLSAHCHDDLGLAVANSLAAVANGARQVEVAVNGLGERAGNCALEEIVMAIKTRREVLGVDTRVNTQQIMAASRLVSQITGFPVPPNKAIVGSNAFKHEAGIHQHGVLVHRATYEIMSPEQIGLNPEEIAQGIVLGKHSGHHAFEKRLKDLGYNLTQDEVARALERFKEVADKKKVVYDEDLHAIVEDVVATGARPTYTIDYLSVTAGSHLIPTATVRLRKGGRVVQRAATGDGPVDAVFKAISSITHIKGELLDYAIRSVTSGREAMGEVTVKVRYKERIYTGVAASTDVIEASAKAYVNCLNRILV